MNNMKYTIMIVDDVEINVIMLEEIMRSEYNIVTATNGEKAIKLMKTEFLPKPLFC